MTFQLARNAIATTATAVAVVAFGVLLLVLPWLYGGVETWARAMAAGTLAVAMFAIAVRLLATPAGSTPRVLLAVLIPPACLIALAGLQLAGGLIPADSNGVYNLPKTIYPAETRLALAGWITVAAAAMVGGTVFSREASFHGLLTICLAATAGVAFGGIAMRLTGEDQVVRGAMTLGAPFARFINRNNAAAFLLLGIASGLALLRSASRPNLLDDTPTYLAFGWRSVDRATLVMIAAILVAFCLAGVVATQSRGGLLAAACTISAAIPFFRWKSLGLRIAVLTAPLAIAAALLFWLGLSSATIQRFESMTLENVLSTGRIPHWIDASQAVAARPLFGAGFGTYGYAFQQFSQQDYDVWFQHADNQHLELLVEAGAAGTLVLAGMAILSILGIARGSNRPVERLLVATVVVGQTAHAAFDFGVIIPATMLPVAALWSAGLVRLLTRDEFSSLSGRDWLAATVALGATVCLAGGLLWSFREYQSAWEVDRHARLIRELTHQDSVEPKRIQDAIEGLEAALRHRPDDAVGHKALADLLVHRYRMITLDQIRRAEPAMSAPDAWQLTRMTSLHRTVSRLLRSGAAAGVDGLRLDPLVQGNLVPARQHYRAAADACPRLPGPWNRLACLEFLDSESESGGTSYLETALRLFPGDSELLQTSGHIALQAGDTSLAGRCWQQSFDVQPSGYWDIVNRLTEEVPPAQAVELTCPRRWESILQIATNVPPNTRVALQNRVGERLASAAADQPDGLAKSRAFAAVDRLAGRLDQAEGRLRELITVFPGEADLHADLANLLRTLGKLTEARDEATLAAALDNRYVALRQQIEWQVRNMPSQHDVTAKKAESQD